jgi:hypothetical protein
LRLAQNHSAIMSAASASRPAARGLPTRMRGSPPEMVSACRNDCSMRPPRMALQDIHAIRPKEHARWIAVTVALGDIHE